MLWRTHIRMANRVLSELGMPKSGFEASQFREGVVTPDKWRDFPHHHGKSRSIERHIIKARGFVLNDELAKACFHLGVALHYIQDSYTSLSTRSRHHTRWEEQMDEAYFTDNLERLVEKAFYNNPDRRREYLQLANLFSRKIEGRESTLQLATMEGPGFRFWGYREWGKPYVDVNFAFRASYLISKSVLASKSSPKLQEELKSAQREYVMKLKEVEISFAMSIVESVRKKCELENRKRKNGFVQKIKNGFLTGLAKKHEFQANRKLEKYKQQKHLTEVLKEYKKTIGKIVIPNRHWYQYDFPKIQLSEIDKELLSIGEASQSLGVEETVIRRLIANNKISCYHVKDEELVIRSELSKQLAT